MSHSSIYNYNTYFSYLKQRQSFWWQKLQFFCNLYNMVTTTTICQGRKLNTRRNKSILFKKKQKKERDLWRGLGLWKVLVTEWFPHLLFCLLGDSSSDSSSLPLKPCPRAHDTSFTWDDPSKGSSFSTSVPRSLLHQICVCCKRHKLKTHCCNTCRVKDGQLCKKTEKFYP